MEEKILQDIAEAKSCLKKEIEEKEELLRFIETLDLSKPVNREEWVKICSTALKKSSILAVYVKNIFPEAESIKILYNKVQFTMYGIDCFLPTWDSVAAEVDAGWFKKFQPQSFIRYSGFYQRTIDFLLIKRPTVSDKVHFAYGKKYELVLSIFIYAIHRKEVMQKCDRQRLKETVSKGYGKYRNYLEQYLEKYIEILHKEKIMMEKIIPKLKKFMENVCPSYYGSNGCIQYSVQEIMKYAEEMPVSRAQSEIKALLDEVNEEESKL